MSVTKIVPHTCWRCSAPIQSYTTQGIGKLVPWLCLVLTMKPQDAFLEHWMPFNFARRTFNLCCSTTTIPYLQFHKHFFLLLYFNRS
jgi:hypothetical protein